MGAGTRPDWENVGIEFSHETITAGKALTQSLRESSAEEQLAKFMHFLETIFNSIIEVLPDVFEDQEIKNDLVPRIKKSMANSLYFEFIGEGGSASGFELSTKDVPPFFEFNIKEREEEKFGLRFLLQDLLDFLESCLEGGRIVVPDILDFYCRGKMQLIMTKRRAEWTGMSLFGGLMFYGPQIWSVMAKRLTGADFFNA